LATQQSGALSKFPAQAVKQRTVIEKPTWCLDLSKLTSRLALTGDTVQIADVFLSVWFVWASRLRFAAACQFDGLAPRLPS